MNKDNSVVDIPATCGICNESIADTEKVTCDRCKNEFHGKCAKINDNMKVWMCEICYRHSAVQTLHPPSAPPRSKAKSKISNATSSTRIRAAVIDSLNEEKKLLEEQDKERERFLKEKHERQIAFMKKRHDTMQNLGSESGSCSSSIQNTSEVDVHEKVKSWIGSVKNPDIEAQAQNLAQNVLRPTYLDENMPRGDVTRPYVHECENVSPRPELSLSSKTLKKEQIAARHIIKELPKFDGNPKNWTRFISSFHRSTEVCGFNDIENLERLTRSLSGPALKAVESSLSLEENVPHVISTLEMLYGKPEFVINSLIEDIRQTPSPNINNIDSLIRYAMEVHNVSTTMKAAKLSDHLWNPILLIELVDKLPAVVKFEWASFKHSNGKCNIEVLGDWLKQKANTLTEILMRPPDLEKAKPKHSVNLHNSAKEDKCSLCDERCKEIADCKTFKGLNLHNRWEAVKRLCLCRICLRSHRMQRCLKDSICGIDGCEYRHHALLHKSKAMNNDDIDTNGQNAVVNFHFNQSTTFFKILPVVLHYQGTSVSTFAMLDDGSSLTLVDKKIANQLKLSGNKQALCLRWTGGIERRDETSETVSLIVSANQNSKRFKLNNVKTIEELNLPSQTVNMDEILKSKYMHLKNIPIESFENVQPTILIGLNQTKLMEVQKYKFGKDQEPAAAKTNIGWCIFGSSSTSANFSGVHVTACTCENTLNELVKKNYALDAIGVSNPSILPIARQDKRALEILNHTVKRVQDRYEAGLLWKYETFNIPNSYHMAVRRHLCLERKMKSKPELRDIINEQIEMYEKKGYAKKINVTEGRSDGWFLPIFTVQNPNKPNKIRLVWDAAAKSEGISLNDLLLKGPDLLTSLPSILLRFRENRIAITGDIREMFHQVEIRKDDRKYQRFIWRKSPVEEFSTYEMLVMTFGASCSPSIAQYVKNKNAERFNEQFPDAVKAIVKNHYVDDWLESVDSPEDALKLANEVKFVHAEGGFEIRNWLSNSEEVIRKLNLRPADYEKSMEISPETVAEKILGMYWRTIEDNFVYQKNIPERFSSIISGIKVPTKREILSVLMSIYDPLGLISHILIFPKILLQRIWRSGKDWDDLINAEHFEQWKIWCNELHHLHEIKIPRWIGLQKAGTQIEIHTFVDASEDAYAAAVYFKVAGHEEPKISLVTAKSRVAPLKGISIPRMELQAAVLGSRLAKYVTENISTQHTICQRYFWSDSETVLKWLSTDNRRYKQFVSCRVGEILEISNVNEWNWIDSHNNVADMATKMKIQNSDSSERWINGPTFLRANVYPKKIITTKEVNEELRPQFITEIVAVHQEAECRISKWNKLRRTYAYVLRFLQNIRKKQQQKDLSIGPISKEEYVHAENYLFRKAQEAEYSNELKEIQKFNVVKNRKSVIFKESPFIDTNGVLRSRSRIQSCETFPADVVKPILLPRDNVITERILQYYHEKYHHQFHSTVFNEVKQRFSIHNLKTKLKSIRRNCQSCKNKAAYPQIPEEGELPPARVAVFSRPFSFVGVDNFGPLYVVNGRRREKRWCLLITCLTTRALHLEIVHSLSTDSCIMGLLRFIARRGKPLEIYSDNGTNFHGTRNELKSVWKDVDQEIIAEKLNDTDIEWKFIPPASPHMGGAWERMVRTVKKCMFAALPTRLPNDELLITILSEVENIVNNRPLTYVPVENDNQEALTPNHFILGSSSGAKSLAHVNSNSEIHRENWHNSQAFANRMWARWTKEYLPTLTRRTKWFDIGNREVSVGDIAILVGEEKGAWPKGRIVDVHKGRDGKIRSADIQLEKGIYTRPVSKIAILDVKGSFGTQATPEYHGPVLNQE